GAFSGHEHSWADDELLLHAPLKAAKRTRKKRGLTIVLSSKRKGPSSLRDCPSKEGRAPKQVTALAGGTARRTSSKANRHRRDRRGLGQRDRRSASPRASSAGRCTSRPTLP